jgi:hypothetical protein
MCDKCDNANTELQAFLTQLEEKYPGVEVDGKPVDRGHHVFVAVYTEAQVRYQELLTKAYLDNLLNAAEGQDAPNADFGSQGDGYRGFPTGTFGARGSKRQDH